MKRLNQREREVAVVATDLFLKGSPEWRIAEYAHLKGLTSEQLSNFLDKLVTLPENVKLTIYNHYRDISRGDCYDKAKGFGIHLNKWLGRKTT
jgi:AAA+ ATPase superfamily predicted ATPase